MTEILFLPDGHTIIQLESSLPIQALIEAVRCGRWLAPPPYGGMLFNAFQQGDQAVELGPIRRSSHKPGT